MKLIKLTVKIGVAFIAFLIVLAAFMPKSGRVSPLATAVSEAAGVESSQVTMANFSNIATGMSYKQVSTILGESGTELSRNDIAGFETVMYQWQSSGLGNMNAMFQNGRLISKAQFGLR